MPIERGTYFGGLFGHAELGCHPAEGALVVLLEPVD